MICNAIEIKDFRGIDHLTINNLGQFNIFIGRNNTGKSACLEAIALLASGNAGFQNSFKEDMLKFITFRRSKSDLGWDYLIRTGADKAQIIGFKNIEGGGAKTEGVTISKTTDNLGLNKNEDLVESIRDQMVHELRRERESVLSSRRREALPKNRLYFYYINGRERLSLLYGGDDYKEVVTASKKIPNVNPPIEDVLFIGNFEEIQAELHDRSAEKGRLFPVIDRLRLKFPEIQDLRRIRDMLYIFYKKGSIPLATMGDGFKASLLVSLSVQTLSSGVLVLEEPENYLHPGLMMHLIEELLLACKQNNIQVFTSTHSEEFLNFCIERSKNIDVSIVRMSRLGDKFEAEVIKKEEAQEHMKQLGIDLRGF
jgi:AAA15 family ATPase/GTPase